MKPLRFQIQYIADAVNRTKAMGELGISPSTFYRYARKYGIEYRRPNSPYRLDKHDDALIQQLLASGMSQRAVAEKFDVSKKSIQNRQDRGRRGVPCREVTHD